MEEREMTQEEMQRYLDQQAKRGASEYEALKGLAEVLGVRYRDAEELAGE